MYVNVLVFIIYQFIFIFIYSFRYCNFNKKEAFAKEYFFNSKIVLVFDLRYDTDNISEITFT